MNFPDTRVVLVVLALASSASTAMADTPMPPRYFAFEASGSAMRQPHEFIVEIDDPAVAEQAEQILMGNQTFDTRIVGTIVAGRADYNESWPFHLDPKSIRFAGNSTEVCDATAQYVEEHLHLVGTGFLPKNEWCPWSARLTRLVKYP